MLNLVLRVKHISCCSFRGRNALFESLKYHGNTQHQDFFLKSERYCEKNTNEIDKMIFPSSGTTPTYKSTYAENETFTFADIMRNRGREWPWKGLESLCLLSNETVTVDLPRSKSFSRKWKNLKRVDDVFPVLSIQGTCIFDFRDFTHLVQISKA